MMLQRIYFLLIQQHFEELQEAFHFDKNVRIMQGFCNTGNFLRIFFWFYGHPVTTGFWNFGHTSHNGSLTQLFLCCAQDHAVLKHFKGQDKISRFYTDFAQEEDIYVENPDKLFIILTPDYSEPFATPRLWNLFLILMQTLFWECKLCVQNPYSNNKIDQKYPMPHFLSFFSQLVHSLFITHTTHGDALTSDVKGFLIKSIYLPFLN